MSIQDIQIDYSRSNQGEAIKSKDWQLVRNKKFHEEELLWDDSQYNINEQKDNKKTEKVIAKQQIKDKLQQWENSNDDHYQKHSLSHRNQNSRRFQYIQKHSTSRTRTFDMDLTNINESSRMNQTSEFTTFKDQRNTFLFNQPQQDSKTRNRTNSFENYKLFYKSLVLITKLKLRLRNFYVNFTNIQKSRLLSGEIRQIINDQSDSIETKEKCFEIIERFLNKFRLFSYLKQLPLFNLSSKTGFYMKLTLVWLNIIYLILFSIFIVFSVKDRFSQYIFQIINFVWIADLTFNFNCQIQQDTEIISSRGKAFLVYVKKRFLFDIFPLVLNSQLEQSSSTLLFQMLQFLKLFNINQDLKYIELQLCMRVKKHYIIQLMNLIFGLFFIGHIIACLWYLIGYVGANYLEDEHSWLNDDLYKNLSWWQIYFSSLYWSLTLMATGSNISLGNLEVMFTTIIMLFTSICFGYLITIIGDILTEMNSKELKRKQDMNTINNHIRQANISKELQANVNLYMQQYYQNNFQEEQQNKQSVIEKLSPDLQEGLKREQFKEIILQLEVLLNKTISQEVLQDITLYIEEEFYYPNQKLKFDNDQYLIFIIQGEGKLKLNFSFLKKNYYLNKVEICNGYQQENSKNSFGRKKLGIGKSYGLIEFITAISSNEVLKSSKFTQIVKIKRTNFIKVIKQNELEYQKFCELRDKILFYSNFQDLNLKCNFCNSYFHQSTNCQQISINQKQIYNKIRINESETQKRSSYKRKKIKNSNPLHILSVIKNQAQILLDDFKKQKQTDILELLNITLSESEQELSDYSNTNTNNKSTIKLQQSYKEIEFHKNFQNLTPQKAESNFRKQSIFLTNKQDQDDCQKVLFLNPASFQEQSPDKSNQNGLETFAQNSFAVLNENQRVNFQESEKDYREGQENNKFSDERVDSFSVISPTKIQAYHTTRKSIKNISQKFLQRVSCLYDNQENNFKENFKQEINKLMDYFKSINQTLQAKDNRKSSNYFLNQYQESNLKAFKLVQNQMMYYDFDLMKDYIYYFPFGNSKEVFQRQKNVIRKKFKRTNVSFLFQNKI